MLASRYGPHAGISTESLSYVQLRHHPEDSANPKMISLFSVDAKICCKPRTLVLRMQDIIHYRKLRPDFSTLRPEDLKNLPLPKFLYICKHRPDMAYTYKCAITTGAAHAYDDVLVCAFHECMQCSTDSLIEVRKWNSTLMLVITRWFDLGPGLSPGDEQWISHVGSLEGERENLDRQDFVDVPQARWERAYGKKSMSMDELLARNLSYLKDERYKKAMGQSASQRAIWRLPYNGVFPDTSCQ
ncbi:hypothetical protein N7456_003251 [Penicillium angulare]|uniref:Uncharacterized protein n=1 Tax=Penicillium angulare TaxID=116970 RepID=A0A9W9KI21_9EURO|nr:hypothetical protein N7456_003251 [Penicillium angulare]